MEIKNKEDNEIHEMLNQKLKIHHNPKILNKEWVKATLNSS